MSKKAILKRSRVKPFIKFVNYQHMMPTRCVPPARSVCTAFALIACLLQLLC